MHKFNIKTNVKKKKRITKFRRRKYLAESGKSSKRLLREVSKMLHHFFPNLKEHIDINSIDPRRKKSCTYKLSELILAAVYMYMMRNGSRSKMNDNRSYVEYRRNYKSLFGLKLPHMDTVDDLLENLDIAVLCQLRKHIISILLKKRVLHKFRLLKQYFTIAIDGTGIFKFAEEEPYPGCPYKTSKTGKVTYSQSIVEAKIVLANGFSISIDTEWVINTDGQTKQDCEQNATKRLLRRLKKEYNRLPICILLDGLYANQPTMKAIKVENNWEFIIVWKDKTLYELQDEIELHRDQNQVVQRSKLRVHNQYQRTESDYEYSPIALSNSSCPIYYAKVREKEIDIRSGIETQSTKFVFMSSLPVNSNNYKEIIQAGRRRWKIENEGFNVQKNNDIAFHHKMNRTNLEGMKNYYLCMQIAHIFDQLLTLSINTYVQCWDIVKNMWQYLNAALTILPEYQPALLEGQKYNYRF